MNKILQHSKTEIILSIIVIVIMLIGILCLSQFTRPFNNWIIIFSKMFFLILSVSIIIYFIFYINQSLIITDVAIIVNTIGLSKKVIEINNIKTINISQSFLKGTTISIKRENSNSITSINTSSKEVIKYFSNLSKKIY